jgi:hypothetical protein
MVTKKKIIENELMKEIVSIRVDALWKMLSQKKDGLFPEPYEEGATGKLDNNGAIFIPGELIYKDVDKMPKKDIIFGSIKSAVWNSFI